VSATCKSCGAPIRWAKTAQGKRMPLNPAPDPRGRLALDATGLIVQGELAAAGDRYTSHFATCPHAAQHRRP